MRTPSHAAYVGLPDFDALVGRPEQLVAWLDAEGGVILRQVADDPVGAEFLGTVWVAEQPRSQRLVPDLAAPHLRPAQEKALLAGEAVHYGGLLAAEREPVREQRHGESRQVGDG